MKQPLLLLLFVIGIPVFAQNTSILKDTILLEEAIVRSYRAKATEPITFININKEEIEKQNVGQDPSQILSSTPAITSYSDAGNYAGYSYYRIRGIDQTRVNMTLDGMPLNESEDQGVYFSNYPDFFNSVQSIQIQRGVGTSSNGVASYAGSIHFQSPDLTDSLKLQAGANYGSYNTHRIYGEFNSGIRNKKALYVRVSDLKSEGYRFHSGNTSKSAFLSGGFFGEKRKLKLVSILGKQKNEMAWIGVPKAVLDKESRTNGNTNEKDDFFQGLFSLQYSEILNAQWNMNAVAYYNYLNGNYDFDLNNFLGLPLNDEMYNYAFEHHFKGVLANANGNWNHFKLNAGFHINQFNRHHVGSEKAMGELYTNTGHKNEMSTFIKLLYRVNRFALFGDIQYRYTSFDYSGSVGFNKLTWNFINPKVGVSYEINRRLNVYYSFGKTGREPTRNDLFNGEDNLLSDEYGDPLFTNMHAEYVNDHELGVRGKFKTWSFSTNLYYMNFKNEIVLNGQYGPNGLPLHGNVAQSFRSGLEMDVKVDLFSGLSYQNASSFSYNRITESGESFQPILTPLIIVHQKLNYRNKLFQTGISTKAQSKSYIDFSNENKLPSYFTMDWYIQISVKSFEINFAVNNISNQQILGHGYLGLDGTPLYSAMAPLNFNMGIKWTL